MPKRNCLCAANPKKKARAKPKAKRNPPKRKRDAKGHFVRTVKRNAPKRKRQTTLVRRVAANAGRRGPVYEVAAVVELTAAESKHWRDSHAFRAATIRKGRAVAAKVRGLVQIISASGKDLYSIRGH